MPRIYKRSTGPLANWHSRYVDADGKQVRVKLGPDRDEAERTLRKLLTEVDQRRKGLIDEDAEALAREGKRPLGEHITEYKTYLKSKGSTPRYITHAVTSVRDAASACGWKYAKAITGDALHQYRSDLASSGMSVAACNRRVRSVKSFTRRLWASGKILRDPLAGVSLLDAEVDRRVIRAAFEDDELAKLFEAAKVETVITTTQRMKLGKRVTARRRFTIPDRDLLFRFAVETGLRLGEIRSLTPASFNWSDDSPTVKVEAKNSKRRKTDVLPLRRDLVAELRPFVERFPARAKPWGDIPESMAQVVKADCEAAGVPFITEDGGQRDFHALRHSFITRLARNGVPLRTVQELARHSTVELTARVYMHLGIRDTSGAVESLPALGGPETAANTG
jgi:integrase